MNVYYMIWMLKKFLFGYSIIISHILVFVNREYFFFEDFEIYIWIGRSEVETNVISIYSIWIFTRFSWYLANYNCDQFFIKLTEKMPDFPTFPGNADANETSLWDFSEFPTGLKLTNAANESKCSFGNQENKMSAL